MSRKNLICFVQILLFVFQLFSASIAQLNFTGTEYLCRPTDNSITINIVADQAIQVYFRYGTQSGNYTDSTNIFLSTAGVPVETVLGPLLSDTRYYYQMVYSENGGISWSRRSEHTFHTRRPEGSTFIFTITSDSHINVGGLGNINEYRLALDNIAADQPDLHLDLGDTFEMDGVNTSAEADANYLFQRSSDLMGRISASTPVFLAIGNHENEEGWNFDDTAPQPIFGMNARKKYFPSPVTDGFYSGNTDASETRINGDHLREDYYAWEWGDALFVVFDPFQYTMTNPYGAFAGEGADDPASGDRWNWTIGLQQYNWLKQTLENSNARYKFMFAHHLLGGTANYVRQGAVPAPWFEWGGYTVNASNQNPVREFDTKRPGWPEPIHQLMIDNGVSAFFHGHDHQFVYEKRDGIVYQLVPSPCMGSSYGFDLYDSSPYVQTGGNLPNSGHLRVTVSPTEALVEYVNTGTGSVTYSYIIDPNDAASFTITASAGVNGNISPSGTVAVTQGHDQSFTITPDGGYQISDVLVDGGSVGAVVEYTFTNIQNNHTIEAGFIPAVPGTAIYFGEIGNAATKTQGTVLTITTTGDVDEGADIIIGYATDPSQNLVAGVADDAGNIYEQAAEAISFAHGRTYIFAAYNVTSLPAGSAITITGNPSVAARAAVAGLFEGLADLNVLDQGLGNPTGSPAITGTTPSAGPTSTTTQSDELVIGVIGTEGPVEDDPGSWENAFTAGPRAGTSGDAANTNWTVSLGYRMVSATGAYTCQKSGITERYWAATIATFKAGPSMYDAIASDFDGSDGFSVTLGHPDGDFISAVATSGTISSLHVYRIDSDASAGTTVLPAGPPEWTLDPLRYWGVKIFGNSAVYGVVYHYGGHPGISEESSLRIAKRDGPSDNTWVVETGTLPDQIEKSITLTGQTGTEYVLGSEMGDNTLPVELTSFSAEVYSNSVGLAWVTESELDNLGFILERSVGEAGDFSEITSYRTNEELLGQGSVSYKTAYGYTDRDIQSGTTYFYRLSDVGINGNTTIDKILRVSVKTGPESYHLYANYPNPFNPTTMIAFTLPADKNVRLDVYNLTGQLVAHLLDKKMPAGKHTVEFDGKSLPSGIYLYRFTSGAFRAVRKMVLTK